MQVTGVKGLGHWATKRMTEERGAVFENMKMFYY